MFGCLIDLIIYVPYSILQNESKEFRELESEFYLLEVSYGALQSSTCLCSEWLNFDRGFVIIWVISIFFIPLFMCST